MTDNNKTKVFLNGFTSWMETHHEVVRGISFADFEQNSAVVLKRDDEQGTGGLYELAEELKRIQGFPDDFELTGTKTNQVKFIGNSVVPLMAQRLVESNYRAVETYFREAA